MDATTGYDATQIANFKSPNGTVQSVDDITIFPIDSLYYKNDEGMLAFSSHLISFLFSTPLPAQSFKIRLVTSAIDTVANTMTICVSYNAVDDEVMSNFSWSISPWEAMNYTVLDYTPENASSISGDSEPSSKTVTAMHQMLCNYSRTENPSGGIFIQESWQLYNWTDPVLNKTWWSHFESDPFTSQMRYWEDWDFAPTNSSYFSCDTKNNVYQVQPPS